MSTAVRPTAETSVSILKTDYDITARILYIKVELFSLSYPIRLLHVKVCYYSEIVFVFIILSVFVLLSILVFMLQNSILDILSRSGPFWVRQFLPVSRQKYLITPLLLILRELPIANSSRRAHKTFQASRR